MGGHEWKFLGKTFEFGRTLSTLEYPKGVGSLRTELVLQPKAHRVGVDMNLLIQMCYGFDGLLMKALSSSFVKPRLPQAAQDILDAVAGKDDLGNLVRFCSQDMVEKLLDLYPALQSATAEVAQAKEVVDAIAPF